MNNNEQNIDNNQNKKDLECIKVLVRCRPLNNKEI